ncbi:oligosaccharide flippase family protein [Salinisphaera sp. SWV1]|uniref:oligosaccharide flippase family protein n=1 Tax=Salinisphaera sp. SWV1 TaxID=3454139 RepID=UPI003F85E386
MSLKSNFWISLGHSGGSFALQFVANIALAHLLLPSEIGVYSVAMAAMGILQALREFGVSRYIIQTKELTDSILRTTFGTAIVIGWGLAAIIFFGRHLVADFYAEPMIATILGWLSVNFVLLPFGQPAIAVLRRERRFGQSTVVSLAGGALTLVVSIAFAAQGAGPLSMAYGSIAGSLATTVLALGFERDHILLRPGLSEWREIWSFGSIASSSNIVIALTAAVPDLAIGRLLGFAPVGIYSRGQGLAIVFEKFFAASLNWIIGPELATMRRDGRKLTSLVSTTTDITVVIGWPALLFLAFNAHNIILLLYGQKWLPAVPVLQLLCVARGIQMLVTCAGSVYEGTGAVKLQFRNEIVIQVVAISLILLGAMYSLEMVAALRIVTSMVVVVVHLTAFRLYAQIGLRHLLASLRAAAVVALGFAALQFLLMVFKPAGPLGTWGVLAELSVDAGVSGFAYLLFLRLSRHFLFTEVRSSLSALSTRIKGLRLLSG